MVLKNWLKNYPHATVQRVARGREPELWKKYKVVSTPTIVLFDPIRNRELVFHGLKDAKALNRNLALLFQAASNDEKGHDE